MSRLSLAAMVLLILSLAACNTGPNPGLGDFVREVPGGDSVLGRNAILAYGCGTCHVIPGVPGADSYVGPPLVAYAQRHYIAGMLINNTDNLIAWLMDPQAHRPGTAMPNLNLSAQEARHMAAYLYTLNR